MRKTTSSDRQARKEARKQEREQAKQDRADERAQRAADSKAKMQASWSNLKRGTPHILSARGMTTLKVKNGRWSATTTRGTQKGSTSNTTAVIYAEYGGVTKRVHGGRVGGGTLVGAVAFGPLGALAGAGLGAAARGSHDYIKVMIINDNDQPLFVAEVERKDMDKAQAFVDAFNASE